MYNLNRKDISMLKEIGFSKIIDDFGEIVGLNIGGDYESVRHAEMCMREFLNEISRDLDPDNHTQLDDEE